MKSLLVIACLSLMSVSQFAHADWGILNPPPGPAVPAGTFLVSGRKPVAPQPLPIPAPAALSPADPNYIANEDLLPPPVRVTTTTTSASAPTNLCQGTFYGTFSGNDPGVVTFLSENHFTMLANQENFDMRGTCVMNSATKIATVSFVLDDESYTFKGQIAVVKTGQVVMKLRQFVNGQSRGTITMTRK